MIQIRTPAKINLCLYVLNKRGDGYHNIFSLMQCIGIYDELSIEPSDTIDVSSDLDIPMEQNLVYKAAALLKAHADVKEGAKITLRKNIPSGAGLGGGSSDAAAVLKGLNTFWSAGMDHAGLMALSSQIGSDVPFFFAGPLAAAQGRGEILTQLAPAFSYPVVVVKPEVSVSTPWAYAQLRRSEELTNMHAKIDNIKLIYQKIRQGDFTLFSSLASNDFEDAVIEHFPVIREIKRKLVEHGACVSLMSGSGSAVFGIFEDMAAALSAEEAMSAHYWCRTSESLAEMPQADV
ncbi:MAG: 4-(cytidine 5'-diphospho)-2-C-methyl-D-erythritol kinase [Dissulfurispiraceae bacterium]|jgi:4-diphosphocytidyl-2-C-methyl-D-erythritol kinase|nr:4-(cytidine 5'-diphospho)-2-C-methyl-D-erythritol kinase [Dissulfurispiraceae bacterium]